jgi:hypothetical protein
MESFLIQVPAHSSNAEAKQDKISDQKLLATQDTKIPQKAKSMPDNPKLLRLQKFVDTHCASGNERCLNTLFILVFLFESTAHFLL